jgi:hypothetical protein
MGGESTTTGESATDPMSRGADASGEREYVVQEGDTLGSIAEKFLGSSEKWREIAEANDIDDASDLTVGRRLTIPAADDTTQMRQEEGETGTPSGSESGTGSESSTGSGSGSSDAPMSDY